MRWATFLFFADVVPFERDIAPFYAPKMAENLMTARGVQKFADDIFKACRNAVRSLNFEAKYLQLTLAFVALLAIGIVGYVGQNWYFTRQAAAAQKSYAQCVRLWQDAQQSGAREGWTQVERVAKSEYSKHARSPFAAYFKLIESRAQHELGNQEEALNAAREAEKLVSKQSPFIGEVRLHAISMGLDSQDEAVKTQAFDELKNFAFDQKAADRDAALYRLGRYHWAKGEVEQAADVWRELVVAYQTEEGFSSAWAEDAARLLDYVPEQ